MAAKNTIILYLFIQITLNLVTVDCNRLNTLKVLLPIFNDFSTNFTLEADEGCYRWSTARLDIIQITPIDYNENLDCSNKAIVSSITKERTRNNALIIAENVYTSQYLRCDVIVDVIHALKIITRTRELLLEEDPVKLEVRAYDNLGNEFSSLLGVEFSWNIVCLGPSKDFTVLNFVKFDDSPYENPPVIDAMEADNKRGNLALIEGLKTGSAKISVNLPHEEYGKVVTDEVQFSVIANLILMPPDVYIMMGDIISFKIFYLSYGNMEEIVLPNKQYYLNTENTDIAVVDQESSKVTGMALGKTRVVLYDRNVVEADPNMKMPAATINVVEAAYIRLSVLPYKNWAILLSEPHDIIAEVFTNTDYKLNLGPGVELRTQVAEPFHVQQRSVNGSWLTGWGVGEGVALVQASLEAISHPKYGRFPLEPPLTVQSDLMIYPPIVLSPSDVILPWDPEHKPKYEIEIVATGGDGKYLWSSSNHTIGVVAQTGYVRTHSFGYFEVSAAMPKNHHNRQSAKFWILPPIRLEIVEFIMEAEVGSVIYLHVALFAEKPSRPGSDQPAVQIPFTKCQELPFSITTSDPRFAPDNRLTIMPVGISCANVAIIGQHVGSSKIRITYTLDGHIYEDSVTVSAYKPLKLLAPTEDVVMAVGTTLHLVFTGGPRPNPAREHDYKRVLTIPEVGTAVIQAIDVTDAHTISGEDDDYTVVEVLCDKLGETEVTLSIGNKPFVPNCKNKESAVTVPIVCGKPRTIQIQPEIKVADASSCPMDLSADKVVVQSNQDIELDVSVRDDCGRTFLNISSLKIDWNISAPAMATYGHKTGIYQRLEHLGTVPLGYKSYQIITPKVETGVIVVTPTLSGYRKEVLLARKVSAESLPYYNAADNVENAAITTSISLYLVDDTVVTPDTMSIYNHPNNRKYLSVKQGSGFYEIALSSADLADVEYQKSSRQLIITPRNDGELKINLIDLCLVSRPAVILVNIVSVSIIRVEMSDKVEIIKCISCIVRLYDETDNLLSVPDMDMVNLQVKLRDDIASVIKVETSGKVLPTGEVHYIIKGLELGDTKLIFSVDSKDPEVTSSPIDLQVFPPLKLYPRNGTLIIGAVLQYSSKGGPQPDSYIEYSVDGKDIAEVQMNGILKGLNLGTTTVQARAVGTNPTTGQKIIYTEDSVVLNIIPIAGIRISAPLSRFKAGTIVPVWATGLPEQLSPMILATREPAITFDWNIEDSGIAMFYGMFKAADIDYEPEDLISIRLIGITPGSTTLYLNATVPGDIANLPQQQFVVFSATLDVEIFEGLELTSPRGFRGKSILMAPNSDIQLNTNKDYESTLKYSLMDEDNVLPTDVKRLSGSSNSIVTVSPTGVMVSRNLLGYAMILVSASDDYGLKQTLSAVVEVKPIHYMLMNLHTKWNVNSSSPVIVVPLGTEFEMRASYHDNTGVIFTAGITDLKLRTSRFDLLKVKLGGDNSSIIVTTRRVGVTVVKIWADGVRKTADYVKVHVQQIIAPILTTITTGDVICFASPLATKLRQAGEWSTSEMNLLTVHSSLGIAHAVGIRGGHVSLAHTLHSAAPLQLLVQPITTLQILADIAEKILTNSHDDVFTVPLVLLSESSEEGKINNLIMGWQCKDELLGMEFDKLPYKCFIKFTNEAVTEDYQNYFSLSASFNPTTGQYGCDITPIVDVATNISTVDTNIIVWAIADGGNDIVSNEMEIAFNPAVNFDRELHLNDESYTTKLIVTGLDRVLDKITVLALDESLIHVYDSERPAENTISFEVRLIDYHWKLDELPDHMSIQLTSPLSEQVEKIHVSTVSANEKFERPTCSIQSHSPVSGFLNNYTQIIVVGISMLVIFAVTFYAYLQYMRPVVLVNLQTSQNPCTPTRSPFLGRNCANATMAQLSMNQTRISPAISPMNTSGAGCGCGSMNGSFATPRDPVYGDPTMYNTSPELRRNRRYI